MPDTTYAIAHAGHYLIYPSCIAYNAGNLNKGSVGTFQNVQAAGNSNVALVSAPVSGGGNNFYVGSSNGTVILIGQYGLDGTAGNVSRTSGNLFNVTGCGELQYVLCGTGYVHGQKWRT
eukprot:Em0014g278a